MHASSIRGRLGPSHGGYPSSPGSGIRLPSSSLLELWRSVVADCCGILVLLYRYWLSSRRSSLSRTHHGESATLIGQVNSKHASDDHPSVLLDCKRALLAAYCGKQLTISLRTSATLHASDATLYRRIPGVVELQHV